MENAQVDIETVLGVYVESLKDANHRLILQAVRIANLEEELRKYKEVVVDENDVT